jgi:hypothetical protein
MKTIQPSLILDTAVKTLEEAIAEYQDYEVHLAGTPEFEYLVPEKLKGFKLSFIVLSEEENRAVLMTKRGAKNIGKIIRACDECGWSFDYYNLPD